MSAPREVVIVVSSIKTPDIYLARSYPQDDIDDNGLIELYRTPIYKVFIDGTDNTGHRARKEWTALRFMPYWNNPKNRDRRYASTGWINSGLPYVPKTAIQQYLPHYEIHNSVSAFEGAIRVHGSFLIHGGPETPVADQWGAAGCVEIIGNFDDFRRNIIELSGLLKTDLHKGMNEIVRERKLFVQYDLATVPQLQSAFDHEAVRRQ